MGEDDIIVRADLQDIKNTIFHLYELSNYFDINNTERFSHLWYKEELEYRIHSVPDQQFIQIVEHVYKEGRDTAVTLSQNLPLINYVEYYPNISGYIERIRNYQEWIPKDSELLTQAEELIKERNKYKINYWAIEQLIKLHREQLSIIKGLDSDLDQIENSERYKIEKGLKRDREMMERKNIFIIHGHNEAKWRELKSIIKDDFKLNPIILMEQPNAGSSTIIEKFERYAPTCSYAFAIFTPDDQIEKDGVTYLQARPNVLFELGWFCAYLGRTKVCVLLQKGTEIFSDFEGVLQKRFNNEVKELYKDITDELKHAELI